MNFYEWTAHCARIVCGTSPTYISMRGLLFFFFYCRRTFTMVLWRGGVSLAWQRNDVGTIAQILKKKNTVICICLYLFNVNACACVQISSKNFLVLFNIYTHIYVNVLMFKCHIRDIKEPEVSEKNYLNLFFIVNIFSLNLYIYCARRSKWKLIEF